MIRYFCSVADTGVWGTTGYAYFDALRQIGRPIRVIPIEMVLRQLPHVDVGVGRWAAWSGAFTTEVSEPFINVVCGDDGPLGRLYTVGGLIKNVAITMVLSKEPTSYEVSSLVHYDSVIAVTIEDAAALGARGVPAVCVPPEPDALGRLLKGLL
jgi:hypothetical protein